MLCKAALKPFLSKSSFIRKLHIDDVVVNNKFQGRRACNVYNNHDPFHAMFFNTQKTGLFLMDFSFYLQVPMINDKRLFG